MSNITEWRSAGASSKYPFAERCRLTSTDGWTIPSDLFVDAQIRLPASIEYVELSDLSRAGGGLSGNVVSGGQHIGAFSFTTETLAGGVAEILDVFGVSCGFIVAADDAPSSLKDLGRSLASFSTGAAVFESSVLFAYPETVLRSISVSETKLSGRVILVEGPGVKLVREGQIIRIDAIGEREGVSNCDRAPEGVALKTINLVPPNDYGNFTIEPGQYAHPNGPDDLRQTLKIDLSGNTLTFSIAK